MIETFPKGSDRDFFCTGGMELRRSALRLLPQGVCTRRQGPPSLRTGRRGPPSLFKLAGPLRGAVVAMGVAAETL